MQVSLGIVAGGDLERRFSSGGSRSQAGAAVFRVTARVLCAPRYGGPSLHGRNNGTLDGTLIHFDQTAFGASASNSMDTNGYVFVPKGCANGHSCGLVVAFHGCLQTQADIGTKFITEAGINAWADSNDIVVLYPFAVQSTSATAYNPNGCWDWWGYDDPNYALKSGTQISIVYKMVQRVMGQ